MIALIFAANFIILFLRRFRKHALLVWICYDFKRVFLYVGIGGIIFVCLWITFFADWSVLNFLGSFRYAQRWVLYSVLAMPVSAFNFGHMASIVVLGLCRSVEQYARRRRIKSA
jgi:hypothetical protein